MKKKNEKAEYQYLFYRSRNKKSNQKGTSFLLGSLRFWRVPHASLVCDACPYPVMCFARSVVALFLLRSHGASLVSQTFIMLCTAAGRALIRHLFFNACPWVFVFSFLPPLFASEIRTDCPKILGLCFAKKVRKEQLKKLRRPRVGCEVHDYLKGSKFH